ncbi:MAG: hypothetical protein DRI57_26095 [Deltaproteobacteria bacterium]|nr:MAG: hypothetical protein DRI57_26095 [Deltaproteobacteria bacterium]
MNDIKVNYDKEADVLYVSFGRSEHITGIELADNIVLRLDAGHPGREAPRAVGLTFVNFSHLMRHYRNQPIRIPLTGLRQLPEALRQAVLAVTTAPPVSDFLDITLSLSLRVPPLPGRAELTEPYLHP